MNNGNRRSPNVFQTRPEISGSCFASALILAAAAGDASGQSCGLLSETFESYTPGAWPGGWSADGNAATDPWSNLIVQDPTNAGNRVLQLYGQVGGCWGSLAYHACAFPSSFIVRARINNGGEPVSGCHPNRGILMLRQGTYWANPSGYLVICSGGSIYTGDGQTILQPCNSGQWYDVKVQYSRSGTTRTLHYWIDGIDRGEITQSIPDLAVEQSYDHLDAHCDEGTVYFDDVCITSSVCYPNCDSSTATPVLNANDFNCYLGKFAIGDAMANCDGSTSTPSLNVNDFQCFLNKFAAGCS